jgi:hypothetical protein
MFHDIFRYLSVKIPTVTEDSFVVFLLKTSDALVEAFGLG